MLAQLEVGLLPGRASSRLRLGRRGHALVDRRDQPIMAYSPMAPELPPPCRGTVTDITRGEILGIPEGLTC